MIYYITFFILSLFLLISDKKDKQIAGYISVFWLIFFAGFRFETGFDYFNYQILYHDYIYYMESWSIEPSIKALIIFTNSLFFGFYGFVFIVALLSLLIKYLFISKYSYLPLVSIFLYYSRIFIIFDFGQIRQGLAFGIVLWASTYIAQKKLKHFSVLILIASTVHVSSLVFFPIYFLAKNDYKRLTYFLLILLSSLMLFVDLKELIVKISILPQFIENKMFFYAEVEADQQIGLNFSSIFRLLLICISLLYKDYLFKTPFEKIIFNIYFFGIIFFLIFQSIPQLGGRGSMYFQQFEVLLIPILLYKFKNIYFKTISYIILIFYCLWGLYSTINSQTSNFFPYKNVLFSWI